MMNTRLTSSYVRIAGLAVLLTAAGVRLPARAGESARALLDRARQLAETTRRWSDRVQHLKLRILDRRGAERSREVVIYFRKYPEDRNRTLLVFESPPEVKGVGILQWVDPHAKDEQWLYLPELKRVRQISAGAKHESFVGTDFSYDDLAIITQITDWTEADARTALLREEAVDGRRCAVIEFTPTGKDVTYGKILVWITVDDLVILKYEMYDTHGERQKILTLSDIRTLGAIPTAFHMEMANVRDGSRTIVDFAEVKYDTGLAESLFTQRALEHGL
jgi:outer membrane lipoprotein-sorting protein